MKTLDRALLAALALGVWVLALGSFLAPGPVQSQAVIDQRDIRQAVNNCQVQGPISGTSINATIVCR